MLFRRECMSPKDKSKGACIINYKNGSKECIPKMTKEECALTCAGKPDAKCELSSEISCPRGK